MYELPINSETGVEQKAVCGNAYTLGSYDSEEEAAGAFDAIVGAHTALWRIEDEVPAQILQPMFGCEQDGGRIDRILIPTQKFISAGWEFGAIGVEIKKSFHKIGRPISQCIDYRRSVFTLSSGYSVCLRQVFLWPFTHTGGDIESVMAQNRVGGVFHNREHIDFYLGQQLVLRIDAQSNVVEFKGPFIASLGRKSGNRG